MGFLRDIDDAFRCNDAGFHEELMTRIYRSAQTGSPSQRFRQKERVCITVGWGRQYSV
jgi:hypothetical protein